MSARKPREGSLAVCGREISFTVDYGKRKHLRIVVEAERGVEVRAPRSASFAMVTEAVQRRAGWIAGALERVHNAALLHPKPSYSEGEEHLFLGVLYPLSIRTGRGLGELSGGRLALRVPSVPADGESVKRSLNRWYASQAEGVFAASMARCLPRCAAFVQCAPPLKARFLRARWGSWSSARGILLNTHLLKAPPECIDYVLLHELCHVRHPNHGKGFYELLESVSPEWKELKKKLEETVRLRLFA